MYRKAQDLDLNKSKKQEGKRNSCPQCSTYLLQRDTVTLLHCDAGEGQTHTSVDIKHSQETETWHWTNLRKQVNQETVTFSTSSAGAKVTSTARKMKFDRIHTPRLTLTSRNEHGLGKCKWKTIKLLENRHKINVWNLELRVLRLDTKNVLKKSRGSDTLYLMQNLKL